jgi:hypothetical protein
VRHAVAYMLLQPSWVSITPAALSAAGCEREIN